MNPEESKREARSFLVGRDPSVDRRFRPRPQRQVRLFDGIDEIAQSDEDFDSSSYDENLDPQTSSEANTFGSDIETSRSEGALVYLRLRPIKSPSSAYAKCGNVLVVKPSSESNSTSNNKNAIEKHFVFTDIFEPSIPQSSVYENCVRAQIESEESFTLLTYGTSGSGKTFTLLGDDSQPGMVPRALEQIFTMYEPKIYPSPTIKLINGRVTLIEDEELLPDLNLRKCLLRDCVETPEMQQARLKICKDHDFIVTKKDDVSVLIWISFVEIYNENVYDLLEPVMTTAQTMAPPSRKNLRIVGNDGKVFIKGVTSVFVKTSVEALHLLRYGLGRVSYASTSINTNSSRSHCIFLIDVLKFFRSGTFTETLFKFCDLAGSERLHKTGNVGSRLKEAQRINASLLVLGRCLDAATNRKKGNEIIPFRESKLTMLLQAALLGKEKLTMIVNVMPTEKYYEENMNVLSFASIAKNIVFKQPVVQPQKQRCSFFLEFSQTKTGSTRDEQIQQLLEENIFLRSEVGRLTAKIEEATALASKEKELHAMELFAREQELRMKLHDSHQETLVKRKQQFEERLKVELENQKRQLEGKFESITRKYQWEIEDLREELEKQNTNKRRTLE